VLTRAQKAEQVEEFKEKLERAKCVYLADYRGVDVQSVNQLRRRIRSEGGGDYEYRVAKNSVLRRAADACGVEGMSGHLTGPTVVALSYGDPAGLAKILVDFEKDQEDFEIKGGVLDGVAVEQTDIAKLATLPTLDELRGKIVGLLQAPATKLVRIVSEPGAQLARVVAARGRQEGEGASS